MTYFGLINVEIHIKKKTLPFWKVAALEKTVDYKQSANTHAVVSEAYPQITDYERLVDQYKGGTA